MFGHAFYLKEFEVLRVFKTSKINIELFLGFEDFVFKTCQKWLKSINKQILENKIDKILPNFMAKQELKCYVNMLHQVLNSLPLIN